MNESIHNTEIKNLNLKYNCNFEEEISVEGNFNNC